METLRFFFSSVTQFLCPQSFIALSGTSRLFRNILHNDSWHRDNDRKKIYFVVEISDNDQTVYGVTVYLGMFNHCKSYVPIGPPSVDDTTYFCELDTHIPYQSIITEWIRSNDRKKYDISSYRIRVHRGSGSHSVKALKYHHRKGIFKRQHGIIVGNNSVYRSTPMILGQKALVEMRKGRRRYVKRSARYVDDSETQEVMSE